MSAAGAIVGGVSVTSRWHGTTPMAKSEGEFAHDSIQDSASIVEYLEALAQGFRNGRLLLCSGKKELILRPHGLLKLEVKAKRKGGGSKLSLRIGWKEVQAPPAKSEPFVISSSDGSAP